MTEALLEARALDISYGGGRPVVHDVDLTLGAGGSLGVVGESGCGKTTLARALVGWIDPSAGEVTVSGRAWSTIAPRDPLRRSVQMIFQDPYTSLNPRLTARETVAEVLRVWDGLGRRESGERAGELLEEVGLPQRVMDRRPRQLSGGQCQRIGIARALAARPQLLVADEPTSSLDVSVQAQILNLLLELRATHQLTMVLISHDLSVVRYMTERAIVMYGGRVVEAGPTAELFDRPAHPYTRLLIDSIPGRTEAPPAAARREAPAQGCVFAGRCPRFEQRCAEAHPPLSQVDGRAYACYRPLELTPPTST